MKYQNPIMPGFNPDPSICRVGKDYYLVNSSFEYFPGVPVYHSTDLAHWEQIGYCLDRKSQLNLDKSCPSGGIYAPTIRYHDGTYYMTTTDVTGCGNFIVSAKDPSGPWSDPVTVDHSGIDPSIFFDDDGRCYYTNASNWKDETGDGACIIQSEINPDTGKRLTDIKPLWRGCGGKFTEGPHLYKINGWYYLLVAEGGTENGHMVNIARSKSVWGPFESCPHNPILTHRHVNSLIQGTGHADMIEAHDGSWWIVFLAYRLTDIYFHHLGRETFLAPLTWDQDGWPVVNGGSPITFDMEAASLPGNSAYSRKGLKENFDSDKIDISLNFIKNPTAENYTFIEKPGWIGLKGGEMNLTNWHSKAGESVTFLGRRQQDMDCAAETCISFDPKEENEEAGLTVYYSAERHYTFHIKYENGRKYLVLHKNVADLVLDAAKIELEQPGSPVYLRVKADSHTYYFSYSFDKKAYKEIGTALTRWVSTEAGPLSFTGVYIGIYATGNGIPCLSTAYFDYFQYIIG